MNADNEEWFPMWLQVLMPLIDDGQVDESDWSGRVRVLKNSIVKTGENARGGGEDEKGVQ